MKRLFDIAGALAGVTVFAPVMLIVAVAVLADDGRPVLFRQERVGYRRRPFVIWKFRTMRGGRVTRAGRILRMSGLDEVPQFFNILRGDMSAVGPRPLMAADVERLGWSPQEFDFRWTVRPGLTGPAQIAGTNTGTESIAFDREYIARWRPLLDCRLIALSFAVNAFGKSRVRAWMRQNRRSSF